MKRAKRKARRRRRPAVDLIAAEGSFGKRLRRIEEALNLGEPSREIAAAIILCAAPNPEDEGVAVAGDGFVSGAYRLSPYREVVFFGPRGMSREEAEAIHRAEILRLLAAHPEYLEPWPNRPQSNIVTLDLGTPEPFVIRRELVTNNNS
jgi:hypothetical protein